MTGVRPRWVPALPRLSNFPELNVRTYVVKDGKPGVWFFSLDAGNAIAVAAARIAVHLPYFWAKMGCHQSNGWTNYHSDRTHPGAAKGFFEARYRPVGEIFHATQGTLEYFLAERYCLYTIDRRGQIMRMEIHHPPWPLQVAEAEIGRNTMAQAAGFALPDERPLLHFAVRQDVAIWPLRRC
jgi:uncharacterized protein YqjF (DUF2071 family)